MNRIRTITFLVALGIVLISFSIIEITNSDQCVIGDEYAGHEARFQLTTEEAVDFDTQIPYVHPFVRVVILILGIMSILTIIIGLERYISFNTACSESREFKSKFAFSLQYAKIDDVIWLSDNYKKSHDATVVNAGLHEFRTQFFSRGIFGDAIDSSKSSVQRATSIKVSEFKRGLYMLSIIASTAPLVGLLGTVFGIINEFVWMEKAETAGISAVAGGIAEALVTTALGLAVAVPTVWLFNYLDSRVDKFAVEMENSAGELINFFLKNQNDWERARLDHLLRLSFAT